MADAMNLESLRFGSLLVRSKVEKAAEGTHWLCDCDCGRSHTARSDNLKSGRAARCIHCSRSQAAASRKKSGVYEMMADRLAPDLKDREFGKLIARHPAPRPASSNSKGRWWFCDCACGGSAVVRSGDLASGNSRSCGCRKRQMASYLRRKGG